MAKKIYLATLDRFGYNLTAAETTEEKAINAIMTEYVRAYKDANGTDPMEDVFDDYSDDAKTYYEVAREDVYVTEMTPGKVEWL